MRHERWMIRSFSLTFAAVTLRLYIPIGMIAGFPFNQAYVAIAWLCWVPNLMAAELFLHFFKTGRPSAGPRQPGSPA